MRLGSLTPYERSDDNTKSHDEEPLTTVLYNMVILAVNLISEKDGKIRPLTFALQNGCCS